ncbi:50S ribosomal protein L25/general stress protein Ctc [Priestia koreensis]|uniref:50S ribosomal protein L25/general stress protein Ctc n=1 Tax=Priestia koreensis TaxID=284581 RepID=UPI001F565C2F|nr:50S ribosomal protein L25/general stress protein Ctc [Priestia koreensis]MCM3006910.1 50S ribosomal protein L25/general stress protein Ctc [Priestia koreensis]UNL85077.1 50S ribosomal protein L25/general stress protein Ctc [Priestia koreensis]
MSTLVKANERNDFKNSARRKIREGGNFPAVVYGNKVEPKAIYLDSAEFIKTIRETGRNGVLNLQVGKEKFSVMLHDIQVDSLKNDIVHADFRVVDMSTEVDADVNIVLVGEAKGVKEGGVLQQSLHQVSVTALPNDIPSEIEVDVTDLEVNDTITLADLKASKKYTLNQDESEAIASVLPPQQEEVTDSGEEQEEGDQEPEAIKEKDDEE